MAAYPTVNYRYLFEEHDKATGTSEVDFNNSTTWHLQTMGREDAKKALEEGPGIGFARHIDQRREKRTRNIKQPASLYDFILNWIGL